MHSKLFMGFFMKKYLLLFSFLFSGFVYSAPVPDNLGGVCLCDDSGDCFGDCEDCEVICDPVCEAVGCVLFTDEEELEEDDNLIFDDIDESETEVADTGMLSLTEGTYADSEEVYVIDDEIVLTNEVDITPSWCD